MKMGSGKLPKQAFKLLSRLLFEHENCIFGFILFYCKKEMEKLCNGWGKTVQRIER